MEWTPERVSELRDRWSIDPSTTRIARAMGTTRNSIIGKSRRLNLQYGHRKRGGRKLNPSHPAISEARTVYVGRVREAGLNILKPGQYQRKIGSQIQKGDWKRFPVFSLTLEERSTCPTTCRQWSSCYGNNLNNSIRFRHGPELEKALWRELALLQADFPHGFVIRLHILGDFYSTEYVELWRRALDAFKGLRVFGYSAWLKGTPIGDAVIALRTARWDRFAIRTSGGHWRHGPHTIVIDRPRRGDRKARGADTIVCPAQTGKTASCSTCALCWSAPNKTIAFLQH